MELRNYPDVKNYICGWGIIAKFVVIGRIQLLTGAV